MSRLCFDMCLVPESAPLWGDMAFANVSPNRFPLLQDMRSGAAGNERMEWIPIVLMGFKIVVLAVAMFFAIKWHHDQDKKKREERGQ